MHSKRFLSVFLLIVLIFCQTTPPALASEAEPVVSEVTETSETPGESEVSGEPETPEVSAAPVVSEPELNAKAALLIETGSERVLYARNEQEELYPASLTKIMTCLLVLEAIDRGELTMDQPVTATEAAMAGLAEDGSTAGITVGETMSVHDLLLCMMVASANEACQILGEAVSGSVSAFVDAMNVRAEELGCVHTHFMNPHGLPDPLHYTSAWDLYLVTKEAMRHPDFMRICDTSSVTVPATNLHKERRLNSTNYLISSYRTSGYLYSEAHGIKTGSTNDAGHCLVSSASRGRLNFISVVLGCERVTLENKEVRVYSFYDTITLFNWGFDNFAYQAVLNETDMITEAPVALSYTNTVALHPERNVELLLPHSISPEDLEQNIQLIAEPVDAPIKENDVLGTLTLSKGSQVYATVNLLAYADVEASRILLALRWVQDQLAKTQVRIGLSAAVVAVAALAIWRLLSGGRPRSGSGKFKIGDRSQYKGKKR